MLPYLTAFYIFQSCHAGPQDTALSFLHPLYRNAHGLLLPSHLHWLWATLQPRSHSLQKPHDAEPWSRLYPDFQRSLLLVSVEPMRLCSCQTQILRVSRQYVDGVWDYASLNLRPRETSRTMERRKIRLETRRMARWNQLRVCACCRPKNRTSLEKHHNLNSQKSRG